ncbi:MAG: hypothetical protein O7C75_21830 [Verrucomicrobia bacterium]|nr:hypothetical protein [Verrucomicrobiota bacterium]
MHHSHWIRILSLLLLSGFSLKSIASDEASERAFVEGVLEKYIDSQGGRELLSTVTSFEMKGTMSLESQGIEIPVVQRIQAPDKVMTTREFPAFGTIREVLNGNAGWEWHPLAGERPLDEAEVKDLLKDSDLQRDLKLFDVYESIRLGPPETIEGYDTIHLIFLDEDGKEEHWYFKENGDLFQKIHTVTAGAASEFESTERFYDFETHQGFRFARRIEYINPAYTAKLTISLCLINQEFDPAIFELPAAINLEGN